jgi:ABC-type maltose transport system permease subunit
MPSPEPAAVKENLVVPVEWGAWAAGLLLLAIPYAGIYVMYNRWK